MADDIDEIEITFGKKNKKKTQEQGGSKQRGKSTSPNSKSGSSGCNSYTYHDYEFLLDRLYERHNEVNRMSEDDRYRRSLFQIPKPNIYKEGSKKTMFSNFSSIVHAINRTRDHLQLYYTIELSTECSIAPSPEDPSAYRMIIKGKFRTEQIESLLNRYLSEYVESPAIPGSYDTKLVRDVSTKLMYVECNKTGSRKFAAPLKHTVNTVTKSDRMKAKEE